MKKLNSLRISALALVTGLAALSAHAGENPSELLAKKVDAQLASLDARVMYLMTDKPLYHPGETIWFRSFELARKTMVAPQGQHGITFQLFDPKGAKLGEKRVLAKDGAAANDFELPAGIAGGKFTLRATSDLGITEDKPLTISVYELPRIKKVLEFQKKSFSSGELVSANLDIKRATGEAIYGGKITAVVTLDGAEIHRLPMNSDMAGRAKIRFSLPKSIAKGDGLLTVLVSDGGVTETIQKRIPIATENVDFKLYPEGGELVNGLASRVYFAAHDPLGEPIEVKGNLLDDTGAIVASLDSFHAGMGRFAFTPQAGKSYKVKLTKPAGIAQTFELPARLDAGCVLASEDDYKSTASTLEMAVACTSAQTVDVTAVVRDRRYALVSAAVPANTKVTVKLPLSANVIGAARVTLFDQKQKPLAERLVYRGLGKDLKVTIVPEKLSYAPRDKVNLTVKVTDGAGKPVPFADLALSVVDDTVLNFADDKTGHLLSRLYLEPEMPGQKVKEPNFYFGSDPKAAQGLDLVMGTQGWRRFVWK